MKGTAEGEIEKKRHEADGEGVHVGRGEQGHLRGNSKAEKEAGKQKGRDKQEGRKSETEVDAVHQGVVAVVRTAGAEGLGDEGVQADEESFAEKDEDEIEAGGNADGGDGLGAVSKAADHHGVLDGHGDPANLGQDKWESEIQRGSQLGAEGGPGEHWTV